MYDMIHIHIDMCHHSYIYIYIPISRMYKYIHMNNDMYTTQ